MDSNEVNRYATSIERQIRDRENYETPDDGREWRDARTPGGRDIEIKSALRERATGRAGRFRVFRGPHTTLSSRRGAYHFVVYRQRGRGAEIVADKTVRARRLQIDSWSASDHDTRQVDGRAEQAKIPIGDLF